jgi:hypothetical protein
MNRIGRTKTKALERSGCADDSSATKLELQLAGWLRAAFDRIYVHEYRQSEGTSSKIIVVSV